MFAFRKSEGYVFVSFSELNFCPGVESKREHFYAGLNMGNPRTTFSIAQSVVENRSLGKIIASRCSSVDLERGHQIQDEFPNSSTINVLL